MMMNRLRVLLVLLSTLSLNGCGGFSLPEGDIQSGKMAFIRYQCNDCHTVVGMEELREGIEPLMTLPLGGEVERIQTYDELMTSIINPSHIISRKFSDKEVSETEVSEADVSKMRVYNDYMTVSDLINLVTFLQAQYELDPYDFTDYSTYS